MCHVSAQGVDERMINVHYYYYHPPMGFQSWSCMHLPGGDSGTIKTINLTKLPTKPAQGLLMNETGRYPVVHRGQADNEAGHDEWDDGQLQHVEEELARKADVPDFAGGVGLGAKSEAEAHHNPQRHGDDQKDDQHVVRPST